MTKSKKLTDEESETLQSEGVDATIMESVSNDPDAVTPTDIATENEAMAAAEREAGVEEGGDPDHPTNVKHGIVLTGGIDSTVLLYHVKNTRPDAKIVPLVLGDRKTVKGFLDDLGVKGEIKTFDIDDSDANAESMRPLLKWAEKNKVGIIHFAANHDEAEESIPNRNFDYFQRLNDLSNDVQISTPFMTVTKEKIIQMAVDLYDIDLSKTAEPLKGKRAEKSDRIRAKGFKGAFSVKHQKWIEDPFAPKPKKEDAREGEQAKP